MKGMYRLLLVAVCAALVLGMTGCKKKPVKTVDVSQSKATDTAKGDGLPDRNLDAELFGPDGKLKPIFFDFDSSALRPDALATLASNAAVLKEADYVQKLVQIAGHCDERGTQEYNLALGERRALAVRTHLISLGISGDRIVTISYGKESPVDPGHSDAAWSKNRRAEFNKAQ